MAAVNELVQTASAQWEELRSGEKLKLQSLSAAWDFAVRVAGGDLDFPLEMDRLNVFGAFTESFDLMREELKRARIQEQAADRSKKELVAKLSHDIKTPVASIQAVSELMALGKTSEKGQKQLLTIQEKVRQNMAARRFLR